MLAGVNDSASMQQSSLQLLDRQPFKVNLIPYNPTGMYDGSSRDRIARFKAILDCRTASLDGAADARARHRRGVRPAGGYRLTIVPGLLTQARVRA